MSNENNNEMIINKKFFVPEDVDATEYNDYKFKLFRVVPPNTVLIRKNILTGNLSVKSSGFSVVFPWHKSKMVSTAKKNIDYPPEEYKTKDGVMVTVDIALTVKITDPRRFETINLNPLQELGVLTKSVMREYIASVTEGVLTGNATQKDPELQFKKSTQQIVNDPRFIQFGKQNGLLVTELYFKNIELPKTLVDDYEKTVMQQKENARRIAEAKTNREIAELEAQRIEITSKAEAEARARLQGLPLEQLIGILVKSGMTMEQIQAYVVANGSNPNNKIVNILGQNNGTTSVISGVEAALGNQNNVVGRRPAKR